MKTVDKALSVLGHPASDKITGFKGVITSVCFDLYGCLQVAITPSALVDGKLADGAWFDINRVQISGDRVMAAPDFSALTIEPEAYNKGPAAKPAQRALPIR